MMDAISQCRDAIHAVGLEPPDVIEPGKLHRFPGLGKRNGNTAGWCKLFDDDLGGCFGDWSSGCLRLSNSNAIDAISSRPIIWVQQWTQGRLLVL